jgi:hypothetical protein
MNIDGTGPWSRFWQWLHVDQFGKRRIFPAGCRRGQALARGRADRRLARDPQVHRTDQRLAALTVAVRVDRCFESSWELLRYGLFKDMTHEEAGAKLGAWCRRQRIAADFELRRVRSMDVLFVILRAESNGRG